MGIVAGTQTRSGSTTFLRLHVLGDRLTGDLHEGGKAAKPARAAKKAAKAPAKAAAKTVAKKAARRK